MNKLLVCFLLLATAALAQISEPRRGYVRDRNGAIRPVLGVTGSYVLGDAIASDVVSAGFGRTFGFAKMQNELVRFRTGEIVERTMAPDGPAVFYMGSKGELDLIYFPLTSDLWRVTDSGYEISNNALQPEAKIAVREDEVSLPSGDRIRVAAGNLQGVEWLSDSLIVARGADALFAIRLNAEILVLQIPEAAR
jgi:hypothetical protein